MKKILLFVNIILLTLTIQAQTIAEIQGPGDDSPLVDQVVTTTGIITATTNQSYFIQDGTAIRSGIYVFDSNFSPAVGDSITITGTVAEFFNLTELVSITDLIVHSSGHDLPEPLILNTADANNEDYEGMLISVSSATCTDTDLGFGEWEINDGSGPLVVDDLLFAFVPTLNVDYAITGPLTFTFGQYKLLPTSADAIIVDLALFFTIDPKENNITQNAITLNWETNIPANAHVEYGLTPNFELGSSNNMHGETSHSITLDGLEPGTIYYTRIYSTSGDDESPSFNRVVATASNSSGKINVYFNHSVDHSVSNGPLAVATSNIVDTIISYIDLAQNTLDVTMYETESDEIVAAINAAHTRGVTVRVISDDVGNNASFDNLDPAIGYIKGNTEGIMHNKFIIVDRNDVDNAWVMTGSMNHTIANLGWDYNNVICIQDQTLAKAYTLEFEEMWGGMGNAPNVLNLKFGAEKSDNTPHCFNVNGVPMELYFSPSDGTAREIKHAIDSAKNEVAFAILVFTENSLGNAVLDAHNRGLDVKGIIDYVEFNGSEFDFLMNNGVDVMDYQNADGSQWPDGPTLHHKYAIIDYETGDNPLLITGSHNWSASANSIHDENYLFIYDADIANIYFQEFNARFNGMLDAIYDPELTPLNIYPNPGSNELMVELPEAGILKLFDLKGISLKQFDFQAGVNAVDVSDLPTGFYLLRSQGFIGKFIKK